MEKKTDGRALIEIFQERPNRLELARKGLRLGGIEGLEKPTVLEIGCGFGEATLELSREFGCVFVGVDFNERHVEIAKERLSESGQGRGEAIYMVGDATDLEFPSEEFDFILSEAAFSLLEEKRKAASEYSRVLKRGGKLIINDFSIRGHVDGKLQKNMTVPCFRGMSKAEEYSEIMEENGFRRIHEEDCSKELLRMAMHLSKSSGRKGGSMDGILKKTPAEMGGEASGDADFKAFLKTARMGYLQLVFEKE